MSNQHKNGFNTPCSSFIQDDQQNMALEEERTPEWSCSDVLLLIKEYGNRPALWDPDCEDYKNRFTKHHKWLELAALFKCSKLQVERKMKILNSQYRRERLKVLRKRKLGKTHKVTWYGYKPFGFMNRRRIKSSDLEADLNTENAIHENGHEFNSSDTQLIPFFDDEEEEDKCLDSGEIPNTPQYLPEPDPVETKEPTQTPHKDEVFKVLYDNKDEWALFGELIAHAFRKLPDDRTRCIVKHKINTVLFESELATYDKTCRLE